MDKPIKLLDYAKNVEYNRRRLINYCQNQGHANINIQSSLSDIVTDVEALAPERETELFYVKCLNIDGTPLMSTQYVEEGAQVALPDIIPEFDPEWLEFGSWQYDCPLDNIVRDTYIMPAYQTKKNAEGIRPTIYKLHIQEDYTGRTIRLRYACKDTCQARYKPTAEGVEPAIGEYPNEYRNAVYTSTRQGCTIKIDWGDGTDVEIHELAAPNSNGTTNITLTHTYTEDGDYVIQMWANRICLQGGFTDYNSGYGLGIDAATVKMCRALQAVYIGDSFMQLGYYFLPTASTNYITDKLQYKHLKHYLLPPRASLVLDRYWGGSALSQSGIEYFILPKEVLNQSDYSPYGAWIALKAVVLPYNKYRDIKSSNGGKDGYSFKDTPSRSSTLVHLQYPMVSSVADGYFVYEICDITTLVKIPKLFQEPTEAAIKNCPSLKDISNLYLSTRYIDCPAISNCPLIETVEIPANSKTINGSKFVGLSGLKRIIFKGNTSITYTSFFEGLYALKEILLPNNYNGTLDARHAFFLTKDNLINIAKQVRDLSEVGTTSTITFHAGLEEILQKTFVDSSYFETSSAAPDAISLLDIFNNKNWTIAFDAAKLWY